MKWYILLLALVVLAGCTSNGKEMTVYKSPTCGCCVGWGNYMEGKGYEINEIEFQDLSPVKKKHNIPKNLESCHTAEVDGYFIEGHVPNSVVTKLLEEKPDLDGIALPRMPSGSPGMPGAKQGEWIIYGVKDGEVSEYTRV